MNVVNEKKSILIFSIFLEFISNQPIFQISSVIPFWIALSVSYKNDYFIGSKNEWCGRKIKMRAQTVNKTFLYLGLSRILSSGSWKW